MYTSPTAYNGNVYDLHIVVRASLLGKSKHMRFYFDYRTLNGITGGGRMWIVCKHIVHNE